MVLQHAAAARPPPPTTLEAFRLRHGHEQHPLNQLPLLLLLFFHPTPQSSWLAGWLHACKAHTMVLCIESSGGGGCLFAYGVVEHCSSELVKVFRAGRTLLVLKQC